VRGPIKLIINAVADEFGITKTALLSDSPRSRFSHARIIAIQLSRELTKASFPMIARAFNRHHTTAMHAADRSQELLLLHPEYFAKRQAVLTRLGRTPS